MAVAPPAKIVYKRKVRCCSIGLVPKQEGVNLTNSDLMVLGYGNRAILSNGFRLAPSQRGHVSARESRMIKILTLLKLIIEVLLTLLR